MRTCFSMDPLTLDPRKSGEQITSVFLSMLYAGLTRLNPDGSSELDLAESVEVQENGRVYEFTLREACWSNGDSITASDFEASWKQSLDPDFSNPCRHLFYLLKGAEKASKKLISLDEVGVKALDAQTLRVELENPTPHFLSLTSFTNFFAVPALLRTKNLEWLDPGMIPVSGPFRLVSWQKREMIQLKKNPLYWDADNVSLETAKIYISKNPYLVFQMFDDGDIDFISNILCSVPNEVIHQYTAQGLAQILPMGGVTFCSFNTTLFPFENQKIRQAFSMAIDRERLIQDSRSLELPAQRLLPPPLAKGIADSQLEHNPALARQLLNQGMKELGVLSGNNDLVHLFFGNLTFSFENSVHQSKLASALQTQWRENLKLQVKLEPADYQTHLQKLFSGNYSMGLGYWLAHSMDPIDILERFKNKELMKNYSRFAHPEYSALLQKTSQNIHPAARLKTLQEAEDFLIQQMPIAPLSHGDHIVIARQQLENVTYLPNGAPRFTRCRTISVDDEKAAAVN